MGCIVLDHHNTTAGLWQRLRSVSLGAWLLLVALLAAIVLTASLGAWQLRRADEKRLLLHQLSVYQAQAVGQDVALLGAAGSRFRRLRLRGVFDSQHPVWQSSQMQDHRLGYVIWMPFHVAGQAHQHKPWVWVNLGWVPQGPDQQPYMPAWQPSATEASHVGIIDVLKTIRVPGVTSQGEPKHWPVVTVHPDWAKLNAHLHRNFYPLSWRLSEPAPDGWVRHHIWVVMSPARHVAYAVQWFALALVFMLCGAWFMYKKGR